jgi:hypothetical protein
MAGTMPHAIFIEENADGSGSVAAYAAELPGCAVFAAGADEAAAEMPGRVVEFVAWLQSRGERAPTFVGDNWYEVERARADAGEMGLRRAAFTLDELSPSDEEFATWMRWLELAREEVADALDSAATLPSAALARVVEQDHSLSEALGGAAAPSGGDVVDQLYAARDALTDALEAAGSSAEGVRRALRLAIADDLRLAAELRGRAD